jgi:acetyl-CoA hydrolase
MTNWMVRFWNKVVPAEKAVQVIKSGDRIFLTGNCSVPQTLLNAVTQRAQAGEVERLEIVQVLTIGDAAYVAPEMEGKIRVNTLFISHNVRKAVNEGRADFTPVFLSEIPRLFRNGHLPLDVALIHCSPPDEHGFLSFGVEVGLTKPAAQNAKIVVAEVNEHMPRCLGDSFIHISKVDYLVPVSYYLPEVPQGAPGELEKCIAGHIVDLIPDGATMQMGIGAIPDAVLHFLEHKKDLGIHTELFSDGVIPLVDAGIINNERKTLHPGKIVAGFILGSQKLYDFVDNNPIVEFHPQDYVNDPFIISQNDRMISINSALEVDLTGQVCADSIGTSFYSGVGGQMDFVYGASRSKEGKPIIALPSTTRNDTITRIVPALKEGAGVTTSRNHVHYVVTEFGVAELYGKSIRQRALNLINVAHPKFRDELTAWAKNHHYI